MDVGPMPRKILAAAVGTALAVLYVIHPAEASPAPIPKTLAALTPVAPPRPVPAASIVDAQGHPVALASFKGRVVILDMWATWCAPCVEELPAVARLAKALGFGKVIVVPVSQSNLDAAATAAFLRKHGAANLTAYRDPDLSLLKPFGAPGLPFSVVIDAKGREIAHASGPMKWDDPAAVAYFKALGGR
jgi:thiol-disulfide isomerase/thioredoxin